MRADSILKIDFNDRISCESARSLINRIISANEKNPKCEEIRIMISSPGGDIDVAIELYNFLKNIDCLVTTVNTSFVNSASIILYLAGKQRLCCVGSSFYVHNVTKQLKGIFSIDDLTREVEEMKASTRKISSILSVETNHKQSYWQGLMRKGCIIESKRALALGLAHSMDL